MSGRLAILLGVSWVLLLSFPNVIRVHVNETFIPRPELLEDTVLNYQFWSAPISG